MKCAFSWPIGSLAHWPLANAMVLQYSAIVISSETGRKKKGGIGWLVSRQWAVAEEGIVEYYQSRRIP